MDHLEAIVEIKNVVSNEFIDKIIPLANHKAKKNLTVMSGLDKNIRNVKGHHLSFDTPTDLFYWNYIKLEIERLYNYYKAKFPQMQSSKINQIDLLKYSPGGKYNIHTDHFTTSIRALSVIINLNDDYEGGDLVFTDQKEKEIKRLKLGKGSIVFFPSNFMYPHGIQPITKGTRYSIVAWLQ
jgi:Rps23 Pro-64 3,4-dihydroxylase Tpa1-like proline 4-hydroxylase|tara:strand:- start:928 stop:1473 length:546 start_codon:yes stop_codon:yes gene_type:complete